MGAPGLAFETWDPSSQFLLETPTFLFVIPSSARGSAVPRNFRGNHYGALSGKTDKHFVRGRAVAQFWRHSRWLGGLSPFSPSHSCNMRQWI
jgi:hypothetical protein